MDHVTAFHRDGFCGPFTLLDPETAIEVGRRVREDIYPVKSEVYAHATADVGTERSLYMRERHLDSPLLYRIAVAPEIQRLVTPLIGPDVLLWRSDIFVQGPGDKPTYPHQDIDLSGTRVIPSIQAGDGETPIAVMQRPSGDVRIPLCASAYIALTPMTAEVGALWVVPGTNRSVIREVPGAGFANRPLVLERNYEPSDGVVIELKPGQFILFHNLLVHGSLPSTAGSRIAWTTRYVSTATKIHHGTTIGPQGQDLSRWGAVLTSGQDRVCQNVMRAAPPLGNGSLLDERSLVQDHRTLA